jgi:hypothetical protein
VWDELNDVPDLPGSYPAVGWLKDDRAFLVSDKYDYWSLDPQQPVRHRTSRPMAGRRGSNTGFSILTRRMITLTRLKNSIL